MTCGGVKDDWDDNDDADYADENDDDAGDAGNDEHSSHSSCLTRSATAADTSIQKCPTLGGGGLGGPSCGLGCTGCGGDAAFGGSYTVNTVGGGGLTVLRVWLQRLWRRRRFWW